MGPNSIFNPLTDFMVAKIKLVIVVVITVKSWSSVTLRLEFIYI